MTERIALVSCGARKLDHAAPARELYTSNLFKLSAAYAERFFDHWYVVSALHGLVDPDRVIAPYEFSLRELRVRERESWAHSVVQAVAPRHKPAHYTVLAGSEYRGLTGVLRWTMVPGVNFMKGCVTGVDEPLAGMPIGKRMQWLKRELEAVAETSYA